MEPVKALRNAGARVTIVSLKPGQIQGVRNDVDKTVKVDVDCEIRDVNTEEFDAVHLPGGTVNADSMRMVPEVQAFLREMQDAGKPITAICHAPWELVSAGLVRGRTLTSYYTLQDDIQNAGGSCWTAKSSRTATGSRADSPATCRRSTGPCLASSRAAWSRAASDIENRS